MKIIYKIFLRKNGFFEREKFCRLCDIGLYKHLFLKNYRVFLRKTRVKKLKLKPYPNKCWEAMGSAFEPIDFYSKIKFKFRK